MIIFTHHTGEPHGILGAQVAAMFFQRKLSIPSIVVGIERDFSKDRSGPSQGQPSDYTPWHVLVVHYCELDSQCKLDYI